MRYTTVLALTGLAVFLTWVIAKRDPHYGADVTHKKAHKAWTGIDWEDR